MTVFKYLSPVGGKKALARSGHVRLKFSLPKEYNDPYELFLEPSPPLEGREEHAFYEVLLGEIPQLPTTCFSKTPDSVTMWAHYCQDHHGICLSINDELLLDQFDVAYFEDVEYSDSPAQIDTNFLRHAMVTGKNRHAEWVRGSAYRAAYFMKRQDWQYEQEKRCIVDYSSVKKRGGLLIAELENTIIESILIGKRADKELQDICQKHASKLGIPVYTFQNGRRTYQPFFISDNDATVVWNKTDFTPVSTCNSCNEPLPVGDEGDCYWCELSDEEHGEAMMSNAYFLFQHYGITEPIFYFAGMNPKGRAASDSVPTTVDIRPPQDPQG